MTSDLKSNLVMRVSQRGPNVQLMSNPAVVDTGVLCSEETEENKKSLKLVMFDSRVSLVNRSQGLEKKKRNIQEFRPCCSAMQWHSGLRLFFKNIYSTYITVPYCIWSVILRPLSSFFFISGPKTTLFEVDCWNDLFSLPFEKGLVYPTVCLPWTFLLYSHFLMS